MVYQPRQVCCVCVVSLLHNVSGTFAQCSPAEEPLITRIPGAIVGQFGITADFDGSRLVVGSTTSGNDESWDRPGAACIYALDDSGSWALEGSYSPAVGERAYSISSAAIAGSVAVLGYPEHRLGGSGRTGAAVVLEHTPFDEWPVAATLSIPDLGNHYYGTAVATDGRQVVVGAPFGGGNPGPGVVFVYDKDDAGQWILGQQIQSPSGTVGDRFGSLIELDGELLAVSIYGDDRFGTDRGSVAVYRRVNEQWVLEVILYPTDASDDSVFFGGVISLSGNHIAATDLRSNVSGVRRADICIFARDQHGGWRQEDRLENPFGLTYTMNYYPRYAMDLDHSRLLIGAAKWLGNVRPHLARVFTRNFLGHWRCEAELSSDQVDGFAQFGFEVCLKDDVAFVAAPDYIIGHDYSRSGAVIPFRLGCDRLALSVRSSCPEAGQMSVSWSGAMPSGRVAILVSESVASFEIPFGQACAGTVLDLDRQSLQVAYIGTSTSSGRGEARSNVPRSICGGFVQLLDLQNCTSSNVIRVE